MVTEALWLSTAGAVVSATAALTGVVINQRATRRREHLARVWGKRADAYVKLMRWLASAEHRLTSMTAPPRADQAAELLPDNEVEAELTAYASHRVEQEFMICVAIIRSWAAPSIRDLSGPPPDDTTEIRTALSDSIRRLRASVRSELAARRNGK
jgi:hypothetical protein